MASRANGSSGTRWRTHAAKARSARTGSFWSSATPGECDVPVEEVHAAAEIDRGRRLSAAALRAQALEEARPGARDRARAQVERLHQALGGEGAVVAVAHRHGERLLVLEAEPVGLPGRAEVQAVPQAPEELLGLGDLVGLARDEDAHLDEPTPGTARRARRAARLLADAVARARGPADPVEVAEPSGAALHVRLEQVHRAAEAVAPRGRLGLEPVDERAEVARRRRAPRWRSRRACAGAPRPRRGDGDRAAPSPSRGTSRASGDDLVGAEDLVADREAGVPQRIEERLDEGSRFLGADDLRVDDEDDIGVAVERDRAATEAPHGRERHAVRQTRLSQRVLEEQLEARVEEARVRAARAPRRLRRPRAARRGSCGAARARRAGRSSRAKSAEYCEACWGSSVEHVGRQGM